MKIKNRNEIKRVLRSNWKLNDRKINIGIKFIKLEYRLKGLKYFRRK